MRKLLVFIVIIVILLCIGFFIYIEISRQPPSTPPYACTWQLLKKGNDSAIVASIEHCPELYWEDVRVISGNATLPNVTIDLLDIITNCSGLLQLEYVPIGVLWYEIDFR